MANKPTDVFKYIDMRDGDITQCWPWQGSINKSDGRPYFTVDGIKKAAYVWTLELFSGEKASARFVLHSCDNPICCNPHHGKWGTHQENMDEMKARERHGMPAVVVNAWRKLRSDGKTFEEIGSTYGVSGEAVRLRLEEDREDDDK